MSSELATALRGRLIGVTLHPVRPVDEALERIDRWSREHGMDVAGLVQDTAPPRQAALEIALRPGAGSVVRLNRRRHVTSGLIKLSLMDPPLTRSQMRDLLPEDIEERLKARTEHLRP